MPKSKDRRAFMDFKMKNVYLNNYEYFDAIDGEDLKDEYEKKLSKENAEKIKYNLKERLGAYGCLMSHCSFIQNLTCDRCIVFEDDVYFHKRFYEILNKLPDDIEKEYDFLYLGYNNYSLSNEQLKAIENNDIFIPVDEKIKTCGTYGLMYTPNAISYLKNVMKTNICYYYETHADTLLWNYVSKNLRSAIINPPLVIPEVRDSVIRHKRDLFEFCKKRMFNVYDYMNVSDYESFIIDNI